MPWFRMDIHWYLDAKIEAAAEAAGPIILSIFPVLLAKAKAQQAGGKVEFTYRSLSRELFSERPEVERAIGALVSADVLSCPEASERGGVLAFDPDTWRKWNEAARKAASREGDGTA